LIPFQSIYQLAVGGSIFPYLIPITIFFTNPIDKARNLDGAIAKSDTHLLGVGDSLKATEGSGESPKALKGGLTIC